MPTALPFFPSPTDTPPFRHSKKKPFNIVNQFSLTVPNLSTNYRESQAKFQRKDFRNAFLAYRLLYSRKRLQRYE